MYGVTSMHIRLVYGVQGMNVMYITVDKFSVCGTFKMAEILPRLDKRKQHY